MSTRFDAVIVAAGAGTRLGYPQPKALVPLAGKTLLSYSITVFLEHPAISGIILVVAPSMLDEVKKLGLPDTISVVTGGAERWQSVRNGCISSDAEWIFVHDAARPFVSRSIIDSLLEKRTDFTGIITATPVVDTIRTFSEDKAGDTIDRSSLIRVGTPQLFHRPTLIDAFSRAASLPSPPTDEAMLLQAMDIPVGIAWGDIKNFKITTREDLDIAEALLKK